MAANNVKDKQYEVTVSNPSGNVWDHDSACSPSISVINGEAGIVARSGRDKVAIVGFAGSTKMLAPFNDPSYEVWGLNQLYRHIPRADRWFDIHDNYDDHVVDGTDHVGWIKSCPIPVYMNKYHPEFPTSTRFPIEQTMDYFGQGGEILDYYTSTVAYMLALAIMEEFTTISIYGIDLIVGTEWEHQKPCVEFYVGYARAKGIHVHIPKESALLKQECRYGYTSRPDGYVTNVDFRDRKKRIDEKRKQLETQLALLDGAAQEDAYWENVYLLRQRGGLIDVKE